MKNFKKVLALIVTLTMIMSLVPFANVSASSGVATITIGSVTAKPGDSVQIPISISDSATNGSNIFGIELYLNYDYNMLTLTGCAAVFKTAGGIVNSSSEIGTEITGGQSIIQQPGLLKISWMDDNAGSSNTHLKPGDQGGYCILTFTVNASASGNYPITLNDQTGLYDCDYATLWTPDLFTTVNGGVDVLTDTPTPAVTDTPVPTDANLTALEVSAGSLPAFAPDTISYPANVGSDVTSTTVTATLSDTNATLKINGVAATSGVASAPISLICGDNVIPVVVTAQAGNEKTYTITITRTTPAASTYSFSSMNLKPTKAFNGTNDVATDSAGNIYVVDYYNNRIVEFTSTGANKWAYGIAGSGVGQFTKPSAIAIDGNGYIYVTDSGNSRVVRFKDTANNGTFGEWVSFGSAGTGPQQFDRPMGIYVKGTNVFVADTYNHRIVKFDPANFVNTWTTFGSMGTANLQFRVPMDVAVDAQNNIWVSDTSNNRVQKLDSAGAWVANYAAALPYGITIDSYGFVYVAERMKADIKCISNNKVYGSQGTGLNQFSNPSGVFVDANNKMFVADISATKIKVAVKQ